MSSKPTYRARRARYEIDCCEPQNCAIASGRINFHALTKGHYPGTPVSKSILPGLNSIGFWNAGSHQDWGLNPHRNEGVEIMFLETGTMAFVADQKKFNLRAGNFTITRPWQLHKLGVPNIGPGRLHWLILDVGVRRPHHDWRWPKWLVLTKADLAELTRKLRHDENPVWNATPVITHAFRELARSVAGWNQPHSVSRLATSLNQLLVGILDALAEQKSHENSQITSPKRTVDIFLSDLENARISAGEVWTLSKMAAHCGMGVSTLSKYCRELVNTGPMEYLTRCRLEQAVLKLQSNPQYSITEIALASGFNSSQYFATVFAKHFKTSPTACRRAALATVRV